MVNAHRMVSGMRLVAYFGQSLALSLSSGDALRTTALALAAMSECRFFFVPDHGLATLAGPRSGLSRDAGGSCRGMASDPAALVGRPRRHRGDGRPST